MPDATSQVLAQYFNLDDTDKAILQAEIGAGRSLGDLVTAAGLGGSGFVVEAPSSSADNVIQPTGAAVVPLTIKGFAGQSTHLTLWQSSTGASLALVDNNGGIAGTYFTHLTYTGSYITTATSGLVVLCRAVGDIGLKVRGVAGQTGDLQQWQDSASAVLAKLTSIGTMHVGNQAAGAAGLVVDPLTGSFNARIQLIGRLAGVAKTAEVYADANGGLILQPFTSQLLAIGQATTTIGFYGATPVAKQTGVAVTIGAVHAALVALGLIGV